MTALLYIENRDLLDNIDLLTNPAVDWPQPMPPSPQLGKKVGMAEHGSGGSTLATQMEKFRPFTRKGAPTPAKRNFVRWPAPVYEPISKGL